MNLDLPEQPMHVLKMIANEVQMRAVTSPLKFFEEAIPLLRSWQCQLPNTPMAYFATLPFNIFPIRISVLMADDGCSFKLYKFSQQTPSTG